VTTCPKCGYIRQPTEQSGHPDTCPSCGIVYHKWQANPALDPKSLRKRRRLQETVIETSNRFSLRALLSYLTYVPTQINPLVYWGRSAAYVIFFVWGWSFILGGISWENIMGSFLHNIILPFHEFGHVLFMPFGQFWMILGGSLFQIMMPLIAMLAFIIQNRDNFAASLMLWWTGHSFIDLSPYIADAPYRALPLIRGMGGEAHDWGNLLSMTGTLQHAASFARISFNSGVIIMIISFFWGGYLINKQKKYAFY